MRSHGKKGTNPSLLHGHESHNSLKEMQIRKNCGQITSIKTCPCLVHLLGGNPLTDVLEVSWNWMNSWLSSGRLCQREQKLSPVSKALVLLDVFSSYLCTGSAQKCCLLSLLGFRSQVVGHESGAVQQWIINQRKKITWLAKWKTWRTFDSTGLKRRGEGDLVWSRFFTFYS